DRTRDLGGTTFFDLHCRYGTSQLTFKMETNADLCAAARKLGREFVIQIAGTVVERSSKNANMATGEIEIIVSALHVLSAAITPPFSIDEISDGGDDIRMKYRSLDLRRLPLLRNLSFSRIVGIETRYYLENFY